VEIQRQLAAAGGFDEPAWQALKQHAAPILGDALLQRLLEEAVVPSASIQRLLAFARQAVLREALNERLTELSVPLETIAAIAHQSFATEYVNEESPAETAGVARLRDAISTARKTRGVVPLHGYAAYACYRPLHTLDGADRVAADLAASAWRSLAVRQIAEPLEEARLRPTIAALTDVVDEVSVAVRQQYEANPYPRWRRIRRETAPTTVAGFLRRSFPHADLEGIGDASARILIAGCGSGRHPVATAQRFPDSSVLAVDLSLTSLAYALRKTRELGIGNVEYRQADLLALGSLSERFDLVECSGVLHHLKDPVTGWRTLCSLLRPRGLMRIGLYSEIARRHVVRAREIVAALGLAPTPEGIRACRRAVLDGQGDPLLARVARGEDFYSLSGCRDLMFHVQEQRFDLPRIGGLLGELGLTLLGFELPDAGTAERYRARFPDDRALSNLVHWHRFETDNPDTFAQMYQFWVRKEP
jgi:2-polyprenyl-3-methyl-5-hydroxy-6-metoxy-1,4-benzoquinol methylase